MNQHTSEQATFSSLGLTQNLLTQLEKLQFTHPTPIQQKAIPAALKGDDVVGIAQTGTGKTLAFALPMIQQIADGLNTGLVVLPTRELAIQVQEEISKVGRYFGLKTAVLIGGASMSLQLQHLRRRPNVIIATPGRLNDHIEQKTVDLSRVKVLVLDEADRMLDMGFAPQIKRILCVLPQERQTMLFSATMPQGIMQIAQQYMHLPVRVEVAPEGTTAENVQQELFVVSQHEKLTLLEHLLQEYKGIVLVFSRTKYGAKKITDALIKKGIRAAEIHSNRSLAQRRAALQGFKDGRYRVLVATDIAARGIDVKDIELVVNYDLPEKAEDYVHRIGRTARAGKDGKAISFAMPDQGYEVTQIEKLIRSQLEIADHPSLSKMSLQKSHTQGSHQRRSSGPRRLAGRGQYAPRGPRRSSPQGRSRGPLRRERQSSF